MAAELTTLAHGMRAALDEAWTSWQAGNFGIGAALVDPEVGGDASIVARGRNAIDADPSGELHLRGNYMAHAEMNVFASMGPYTARGLHLHTTLEPCLMCAGTALFLNVEHVHFAVRDEFFTDLDTLWHHNEYTAARAPASSHSIDGRLASFCRLLPLTYTFATRPGSAMEARARERRPRLADLAADGIALGWRDGTGLEAAVAEIWDDLPDDEYVG